MSLTVALALFGAAVLAAMAVHLWWQARRAQPRRVMPARPTEAREPAMGAEGGVEPSFDAPLDDANTERYAKLVKEMAAGTQFLFISHNKIAMEMAEQLIGVTMQEQGVSRIVAVDMESAVSMAEAA